MTEYYEILIPIRLEARSMEEAKAKAAQIKIMIGDEVIDVNEVRVLGTDAGTDGGSQP